MAPKRNQICEPYLEHINIYLFEFKRKHLLYQNTWNKVYFLTLSFFYGNRIPLRTMDVEALTHNTTAQLHEIATPLILKATGDRHFLLLIKIAIRIYEMISIQFIKQFIHKSKVNYGFKYSFYPQCWYIKKYYLKINLSIQIINFFKYYAMYLYPSIYILKIRFIETFLLLLRFLENYFLTFT